MALSPFPVNHQTFPSSSHSLCYLLLQTRNHFPNNSFRVLKFKLSCCSHQTIKVGVEISRKKRKPRPSFLDQIKDKWSQKPIISTRKKFPWQEKDGIVEEEEEEREQSFGAILSESKCDKVPRKEVIDPVASRVISAPWSHGRKFNEPHFDFVPEISNFESKIGESFASKKLIEFPGGNTVEVVGGQIEKLKLIDDDANFNNQTIGLPVDKEVAAVDRLKDVVYSREYFEVSTSGDEGGSVEGDSRRSMKRSNTETAERTIPEHELRRLRNVALRMVERTKVGVAGITQALVEYIHERWKLDEVVKLKFEEPLSLNMKRTHEILEKRTGGLVIWRSGGSVVLYRGMAYKLHCVQLFSRQNQADMNALDCSNDVKDDASQNLVVKDSARTMKSFMPSSEYLKDLSKEELMDLCELNHLLDELGPRYKDWSGREPLPVDGDLLPPVVPGYQPPFRRLPYGIRHCLKDCEMTTFRRLARAVPPHFALGRNRELQGLAQAMVKLWERSAIAKIAIKRGVQNTRNERMAEELKQLTGGTLLSRNKEFIVFYRGNDFLPPIIMRTLTERQKSRNLQQEEEEKARERALALVGPNAKASKLPLVAGTLAETTAATSRWGHQPSLDEVEEMKRNSALMQQASLVSHLGKKLALAKGKLRKANKALAKVQEHLEPADLPTDLETLSDEERILFRRIGLSMKPYLLLGRRGVYDGTIENMHLHWKYRELVKIIVKGESFAQVKHIAISLEAESGGVLVSLDKTTKGYAIIIYRGKNYLRPCVLRPKNLLTKRQALAHSVELQRREALKHHISDLQEKIELAKSELEEMKTGKEIDVVKTSYSRLNETPLSHEDFVEEEWEEEYLEKYGSGKEDGYEQKELMPERPAR
ncbi:CRM-domain containing factor CFM3, chloroplastic/mitochondrial isoform X1 [Durio zibethinus]|uniref:CRM-domain containing factor CFM3, chloroplastic/mitochondrial isoform X1 n=1 Tax=Durio zibethinus TaxID=66656 RepID=A0A6P5ZC27_DURZI|nr:CRM-domain containing factor CFM3, chloroplastic/mitochondrial isoform X1 [Durio zibethinus]